MHLISRWALALGIIICGCVAFSSRSFFASTASRELKGAKEGLVVDPATSSGCRISLDPPRSLYWKQRANHVMYREGGVLMRLAREYAHDALSVLDVGAFDPGHISKFDWIPTKVGTDKQLHSTAVEPWAKARGVAFVHGDFLNLKFPAGFDLVTCNQVVEHLPDGVVERFVQKMMSHAKVLIVSTTHNVSHGVVDGHVQDPISEQKFRSWFSSSGHILKHESINPITGAHDDNFKLYNKELGQKSIVKNQIIVWSRD